MKKLKVFEDLFRFCIRVHLDPKPFEFIFHVLHLVHCSLIQMGLDINKETVFLKVMYLRNATFSITINMQSLNLSSCSTWIKVNDSEIKEGKRTMYFQIAGNHIYLCRLYLSMTTFLCLFVPVYKVSEGFFIKTICIIH